MEIKSTGKENLLKSTANEIIVSDRGERGKTQLKLSKDKNLWLYKTIVSQLQKELYNFSGFKVVLSVLENGEELFKNLQKETQIGLLSELVKKLSVGDSMVNLKSLNGNSQAGVIYLGKKIKNKNIKIVIRSVTGSCEKIIPLGEV